MPSSLLFSVIIYILVGVFAQKASIYRNGFGYLCAQQIPNCLYDKCIFNLGGWPLCVECTPGHVPINGECTPVDDSRVTNSGCDKSQGGWCESCTGNYFLFYGGCYELSGSWKESICDQADGGVCKKCGKGNLVYPPIVFENPNSESPERCIFCGDSIGFGGYSGVLNCLNCRSPRSTRKTEADCYSCLESNNMCPFDNQCKYVENEAKGGSCKYCPETHLWSSHSCYAVNSLTGASICLRENIIEISGQSICIKCTNQSEVPINGRCVPIADINDICDKDLTTGSCTKCNDDGSIKYYLFYGGCYIYGYADEDQFGSHICQELDGNTCKKCKDGNLDVFTNEKGCWSCGDALNGGITDCKKCEVKDDGVQCLECYGLYRSLNKKICLEKCPSGQRGTFDPEHKFICTCEKGFYPKNGECMKCKMKNCVECDETSCKECQYGYTFSGNRCVATNCKDPNCDTCKNKYLCTKCKDKYSLDINNLCVKNCLESVGYYEEIIEGVSRCLVCTINNCAVCKSKEKCGSCRNKFYITKSETCEPCDPTCATCSGPNSNDCTSCSVKTRLQYDDNGEKGSCVQQCVVNDSCKECGLKIDGTEYCSHCAIDTEYPKNGVCVSNVASRTITSYCRYVSNGVCNACDTNSFILNGGCYTSKLLPGKTVCKAERHGVCESTTIGYEITNSGVLRICPANCTVCNVGICNACSFGFFLNKGRCNACPEGCATCSNSQACFYCLPGYYFSENICKACHKAIPKCNLCMVPKNAVEPVCLEYGYALEKPGLSIGAISGIGVGVVLVVGGVTVVLVWFFVFRKKR